MYGLFSFNRSYTSYFQYIVSAYCKNQLWGRHCNELNITMDCIAMNCISIEGLRNIKKKLPSDEDITFPITVSVKFIRVSSSDFRKISKK